MMLRAVAVPVLLVLPACSYDPADDPFSPEAWNAMMQDAAAQGAAIRQKLLEDGMTPAQIDQMFSLGSSRRPSFRCLRA